MIKEKNLPLCIAFLHPIGLDMKVDCMVSLLTQEVFK